MTSGDKLVCEDSSNICNSSLLWANLHLAPRLHAFPNLHIFASLERILGSLVDVEDAELRVMSDLLQDPVSLLLLVLQMVVPPALALSELSCSLSVPSVLVVS